MFFVLYFSPFSPDIHNYIPGVYISTAECKININAWWRHEGKHFLRYWPFVRGIHRSPVNSPHKGQWRRALIFSLICVWINGRVNNGEAGDLRRHCSHYDVIVMMVTQITPVWCWFILVLWKLWYRYICKYMFFVLYFSIFSPDIHKYISGVYISTVERKVNINIELHIAIGINISSILGEFWMSSYECR